MRDYYCIVVGYTALEEFFYEPDNFTVIHTWTIEIKTC